MPTRKGSDNRFPLVRLVEDAIDSDPTPAGELHLRADEATSLLYTVDDAGNVEMWPSLDSAILKAIADAKGDLIVATAADTVARLAVGSNGDVLTANSALTHGMEWAAPSGGPGGSEDPVEEVFGSPDTAFEFDTSSFTGLTAIGSATTEDADTTVPGHYYITRSATSSVAMCGRYASVSSPFTAIAKVSDFTAVGADFNRCTGLFMAAASPGAIESIHLVTASSDWTLAHERYTNSTTYDTTLGTNIPVKGIQFPLYYMIVCNSTTDVDWWYSFGGRVWRKRTDARNPGFTPGSVGVIVDPSHASFAVAAAFDYLRIWNSALTIPGI